MIKLNGKTIYDTSTDFFEEVANREPFRSSALTELILDFATFMSNRNECGVINRFRLIPEGTPGQLIPTTCRNIVEREGAAMQEELKQVSEKALLEHGFTPDGKPSEGCTFVPNESQFIPEETVINVAKALKLTDIDPKDYELPDSVVNISADDVFVKKQSDVRPKQESKKSPKRVSNTVLCVEQPGKNVWIDDINIEDIDTEADVDIKIEDMDTEADADINTTTDETDAGKRKCILNSCNVKLTMLILIGFLLRFGLMSKQLVFFADGARDLNIAITKLGEFASVKLILDWYHLNKKMGEQLSLAMRGKVHRNAIWEKVMPLLWKGDVDGAIRLIKAIDSGTVKDMEVIEYIIEYLTRNKKFIPCYMLRKALKLQNSSNRGEKSNDIVVSSRQKHNGMSWSNEGSLSLATVSAIKHNQQLNNWGYNNTIDFSLTGFAEAA